MKIESVFAFYPSYLWEIVSKHVRFAGMYLRYWRTLQRVRRDVRPYTDSAMTPVQASDVDVLELFSATQGGGKAAERERRRQAALSDAT